MLRTMVSVSAFAGEVETAGAMLAALTDLSGPVVAATCWMPLACGGAFMSGWVACIFTVALGRAGAELFGASVGRLMRAVSFFGDAGFATIPEPTGAAGGGMAPEGAGFSGTVGLLESGGGFGGGVSPLIGFESGGGAGGAEGRVIGGGGTMPEEGRETFEVSFFGELPVDSGMLIRTVSRFATGLSVEEGSVIRIVSFLSDSSFGPAGVAGFSSAMACSWERIFLSQWRSGVSTALSKLSRICARGNDCRSPECRGAGMPLPPPQAERMSQFTSWLL